MKTPYLSLYTGETPGGESPATVGVKLADVMNWLEDARRHERTWLSDFADDDLQISADLYEVLRAYGAIRKSA